MTFIGDDLLRPAQHELPRRFAGHATDWPSLEEKAARGLPVNSLLVGPRVRLIDEEAVLGCVYRFLEQIPNASDRYSERWRQADTIHIISREPITTGASKVLALHTLRRP